MRRKKNYWLSSSYKFHGFKFKDIISINSGRRGSGIAQSLQRVPCDFSERPEEERRAFTSVTWCDSCSFCSLGMLEPSEFKLGDKIYLEGKCARCGSSIISEIIPKEKAGGDVDIIDPIQDPSKPALTYLRRGFSPSPFKRGYTDYDYPYIKMGGKPSLPLKVVLWIIGLVAIFYFFYNIFLNFVYG